MAGHSKFKNIMHRKGAQDAKRGKVFTKIGREIYVAVREGGGGDPSTNHRLRAALLTAKSVNMPKDNVEKAIKRAQSIGEGDNYESITYEGYGPAGVAVVVEALTDNRNRSASEIRSIFNKNNGNMGAGGSVSFMFDHLGVIRINKDDVDFDQLFGYVEEASVEDLIEEDDEYVLLTQVANAHKVSKIIESKLPNSEILTTLEWIPKTTETLKEEYKAGFTKFINELDDCDDVQKVYHNCIYEIE